MSGNSKTRRLGAGLTVPAADLADVTDNSGGVSGDGTIAAIAEDTTGGASSADHDDTINAIATLAAKLNEVLDLLNNPD